MSEPASRTSRREHPVFNRTDRIVEGWYWALRSDELRRGQVRPLNLMGKELAISEPSTTAGMPATTPCRKGLLAPSTPAHTPEMNWISAHPWAVRESSA